MSLKQMHIDLAGPLGNSHFLLGTAQLLALHLGKDGVSICNRMKSGDYISLLDVFKSEFGDHVNLINAPK